MKKLVEKEICILNTEYKVYLVSAEDEELIKYVNDYYKTEFTVNDVKTENQGLTFYKTGYHPIIWLRKRVKYPLAVVAHEAVHAVNHIWEAINETTKDEIYAHSIESIVREAEISGIFNLIKKTNK